MNRFSWALGAAISTQIVGCDLRLPDDGSSSTTAEATASIHAQTAGDAATTVTKAQTAEAVPACGKGHRRMTVHFYDVGQALSALVDLPDGRHVLVDTGERAPRSSGCRLCADEEPLLAKLRADLHGAAIDLLWITHQHADHIGGAPSVLKSFVVKRYVDNGRDGDKPEVRRAHRAAAKSGAAMDVVNPSHPHVPLEDSADVALKAIVPVAWPPSCAHDPNECSIGLRIDFCGSSAFFPGDAEHDEEALLDPGRVTLLQVAHHGSETSTTPAFLVKARPRYAVISAGKPGQGHNREYCHPRALVVQRLTRLLGGAGSKKLLSFDGDRCDRAVATDWIEVPTSDRLFATERDGDLTLFTTGDGTFASPAGTAPESPALSLADPVLDDASPDAPPLDSGARP